jgi:hypothetical protein
MIKSHCLMTLMCTASLSLSACSSKTVEPQKYTGFLHDYSVLSEHTSPSGQSVLGWVSPALARGRYTRPIWRPVSSTPASRRPSEFR